MHVVGHVGLRVDGRVDELRVEGFRVNSGASR
jgi:hypothetical protein